MGFLSLRPLPLYRRPRPVRPARLCRPRSFSTRYSHPLARLPPLPPPPTQPLVPNGSPPCLIQPQPRSQPLRLSPRNKRGTTQAHAQRQRPCQVGFCPFSTHLHGEQRLICALTAYGMPVARPGGGVSGPAGTSTPAPSGASKPVNPADPVLKRDYTTEQATRQMIRDLVSTMDPEMKIEREVEDVRSDACFGRYQTSKSHSAGVQMLFDIASEFIESVTNFSCRLARHRGSDTLDIKDLQLHLGARPPSHCPS